MIFSSGSHGPHPPVRPLLAFLLLLAGCSSNRIPEPSSYKSGVRASVAEAKREVTLVPLRKALRGALFVEPIEFKLEHVGPPKLDQSLEAMAAWTQRYTLEGLAARGFTASPKRPKKSAAAPAATATIKGRGTWSYKGPEFDGEPLVHYDVKQAFEIKICDGDLPSDCVVVRAPRDAGAEIKALIVLPVASAARLAGKQNAEVILAAFDAAAYKP